MGWVPGWFEGEWNLTRSLCGDFFLLVAPLQTPVVAEDGRGHGGGSHGGCDGEGELHCCGRLLVGWMFVREREEVVDGMNWLEEAIVVWDEQKNRLFEASMPILYTIQPTRTEPTTPLPQLCIYTPRPSVHHRR